MDQNTFAKEQESSLTNVETGLDRLIAINFEIKTKMSEDAQLFDGLESNICDTSSRTRSTNKTIHEIIRAQSSHVAVVIVLILIIAVLGYFVFRKKIKIKSHHVIDIISTDILFLCVSKGCPCYRHRT